MRIQIATVGKTEGPIIEGFWHFGGDYIFLLHSIGTVAEAKNIRKRILEITNDDACRLIEIDPFDMNSVVAAISKVRIEHPDSEILVNMTGGTNIMASAALIGCFMNSATAFYIMEHKGSTPVSLASRVRVLPIPKVQLSSLDKNQIVILKELRKHGGEIEAANSTISRLLDQTPQLVSYHLRGLCSKGLITMETKGRQKSARLTESGRLYSDILERSM